MTCARSYAWFLNFLSNGEGLDRFSRPNVLPKVSKVTDLSKTSKGEIRVNFDLLKVSKMTKFWTAQSQQNYQFENL